MHVHWVEATKLRFLAWQQGSIFRTITASKSSDLEHYKTVDAIGITVISQQAMDFMDIARIIMGKAQQLAEAAFQVGNRLPWA